MGLRRLFGRLLWLLAAVYGLLGFVTDWVGRTTFFDDFGAFAKWARPVIQTVAEIPAFWFYASVSALVLVGVSLHIPEEVWRRLFGLVAGPAKQTVPDDSVQVSVDHEPTPYASVMDGFSAAFLVQLIVRSERRRQYIFDIGAASGGGVSLVITPDRRLLFLVTDEYDEPHSIYYDIDATHLRYHEFTSVYVALGVANSFSVMSIWIDGVRRSEHRFPFPIRIGEIDFGQMSIGGNREGTANARMRMGRMMTIGRTLKADEIDVVVRWQREPLDGDGTANATPPITR